jgi:hypothetical protein
MTLKHRYPALLKRKKEKYQKQCAENRILKKEGEDHELQ